MACAACVAIAKQALPFIQLSTASQHRWDQITEYLSNMKVDKRDSACVLIEDDVKLLDYPKKKIVRTKRQILRLLNAKTKSTIELPDTFKCPECDKKHISVHMLNKHMKNNKTIMCLHCNEIVSRDNLDKHVKTCHQLTVFTCNICNKIFNIKKRYILHTLACKKDNGKQKYECFMCEMSFITENNLNAHCVRRHNPRICRGCDKKFISWECYVYHSRCCIHVKRQNKFICDYCSKEFRLKTVLQLHIRLNHTVGWQLQCDQCGKKFSNPAHLKEHDNTHNRVEDRYVCTMCNAKYSTRRGYERHYKRHFDEQGRLIEYTPRRRRRTFVCVICNHMFEFKKALDRHLKFKHDIIHWQDPNEIKK